MSTCSVNTVPGCSRWESWEGLDIEARGTKLFHSGQVVVSRRASSTGWEGALMVVVACTVNEEPD